MANQQNPQHAIPQQFTDAMTAINTATNEVATEVARLRDQVNTGMTQAEVDAFSAEMLAVVERLKGIAADPGNPVPPLTTKRKP